MFLGHYAVGLAAKRMTPALSLGLLFGASHIPDMPLTFGGDTRLGLWRATGAIQCPVSASSRTVIQRAARKIAAMMA